jgi:hypothetical protein
MKIARNLCLVAVAGFLVWITQVSGSPLAKAIMFWSLVVSAIGSAAFLALTIIEFIGHYNAAQINRKRGFVRPVQGAFDRWLSRRRFDERRRIEDDKTLEG